VPGVLVVDIGIAQKLLKMPDQLSRLLIGKTKGKRAALEAIAGEKLRLIEPSAESDLERLTDSFHLNLTAFGLLSFFVGLFIVNSAIGLAFEQRLPMLRTLRACGVSARMLNSVMVIELVSLALVAGLAGLVCGYFIAAALLPDVAASLRGLYGAQIPGQLTLKIEWWFAGIAISLTVEGQYQNLRRFIRDLETNKQFVIINSVELERATETDSAAAVAGDPAAGARSSLVSLRLEMATYFQRGSTEALAGSDGVH